MTFRKSHYADQGLADRADQGDYPIDRDRGNFSKEGDQIATHFDSRTFPTVVSGDS